MLSYLNLKRMGCACAIFSSVWLEPTMADQVLTGHVPAATATLTPTGRMPAGQRLNLAIGLPLRNREALTEFVRELYDPSNPLFHQFITPQQFTQNFGPNVEDYDAVLEFARANNFTITATHPNRVLVDVSATVADIERALHVSLNVYQHPTEARNFYAPDRAPSLALSVPIASISGLDNFTLPRPHSHIKPLSEVTGPTPNAGSGPSGLYMGGDFRAAYAPGVSLNGSGQTVGLLQFDGYYASDITTYESQAGLPNVPLQNVLLDSFNGNPGNNNTEVALDIEMVASMAPGVSLIMVYEAGPTGFPNDILNQMANDNRAKQISSSWTWGGGTNSITDGIFLQFAAQGQSYFNASGDSDAYTNNIAANDAPADDAYITVVGGTILSTTGGGGSYVSETTWNRYNGIGTGGGISSTYFLPSWQSGIDMNANLGSTTMRNIPDVALTAENVYLIANNGKAYSVGGTSCASPLWAGFTALINQQAVANSKPPMGFLNPAIYNIGKGANYSSTLHDITTGNNTNTASGGKFPAVPGYDLCTGWGSPLGQPLIDALAPPNNIPILAAAGSALLVEGCSPTNGVIDPGETVSLSFTLQNTGGAPTTNLIATLLAANGVTSPSVAQNFGVLPANGGSSSRTFSFTATGSCGNTITPALQLQDGAVNLGTIAFPQVLGVLAPQNTTQNFDSVTAPALPSGWTSVLLAGSQNSWVTTTAASDTAPNAAFIADSSSSGENALVSPPIPIASSTAQLNFRQNYGFDVKVNGINKHYNDGGVLEIQIGNGGFVDILSAGGSFVSGGYTVTINSGTGNALGGSAGWGGSSSGWVTATVNLPASAAGQTIQLRWVCGTDSGNSSSVTGWYVDSISIQDSAYVCCSGAVNVAPSFTLQPTNTSVVQNGQASFQSAATGTPAPNYQWWFNRTNLLAGQTSASLNLNNVQPSQAGAYSVVASNIAGMATSSVAQLTVYVAPAFSLQPSNTTVIESAAATFQCAASGNPAPQFQWYFNVTNLLSGQTSATLALNNVQPSQAGAYSVRASNIAGIATSTVAQLTVLVPPAITNQPSTATVIQGGNTNFQVTATGTPVLAYQWFFNGTNVLTGQTASQLAITNAQPWQMGSYQVVITNSAGSTTSSAALLRVLVSPMITLSSFDVSGSTVSVSLSSLSGLNYTLEYKDSLTDSNWTVLPITTTGTGNTITLQDTNAVPANRFYRVTCN